MTRIDLFGLLEDSLYELDNRIGTEFWSDRPDALKSKTHGWILAEIAEIRCFVSALKERVGE